MARKPLPKQCASCRKIYKSQFKRHELTCSQGFKAGWLRMDRDYQYLTKAKRASSQKSADPNYAATPRNEMGKFKPAQADVASFTASDIKMPK